MMLWFNVKYIDFSGISTKQQTRCHCLTCCQTSIPENTCVAIYVKVRLLDRQTDAGQSDTYVPQCFAGDT